MYRLLAITWCACLGIVIWEAFKKESVVSPWPGQEPPLNQCPLASLLYCRSWATLSNAWCVPLLDCDWDWMFEPSRIMATIVRSDWGTKLTWHASSKEPVNVACSYKMSIRTILAARARQMASSSKSSLQNLRRAAPISLSKARTTFRPCKLSGLGSGQGYNF